MKRKLFLAVLIVAVVCPPGGWLRVFAQDYTVATVGNEKIMFSEIEKASQGLNRFLKENYDTSREYRVEFIRQYVARYALAKKATREGADKQDDVKYRMEQARMTILADKLLVEELKKAKATEENLKAYYESNKGRYMTPAAIKVSYVGFDDKTRIDALAAKIEKGKSLESAAKKDIVKIDKIWIGEGMPFPVEELAGVPSPEFRPLFSLDAGKCSAPMKMGKKYYIFRIDEKTPQKQMAFDEARKMVELEYLSSARSKVLTDYISGVFKEEGVVIKESEIK